MATAKKAAATKAPAKSAATPEVAVKKSVTKVAAAPAATEVAAVKKVATKAAKAAAPVTKPAAGFMKPLTPSKALAAVVGAKPLPRTEVTKKVWVYIKKHKLQDEANKRMINADAKLKEIFKVDQVSMFEMTKLISAHLS
ncbi:SWIB/MDM2 domain-containing protein [Leptothrix ochracea]|uniref:SWIB/MDM2 domain-containing protein n=1 Tax=Leptothrix ochracea TaxID=735331 RepID=UPI0034E1B1D1